MNPMSKLSPNAIKQIRMDHTHVLATFHRYEINGSPNTKQALVNTISAALEIHAQLEEEIFYPAMRSVDPKLVAKSVPEHGEMRTLIDKLRDMEPTDRHYDDTVMELMGGVMHHVADEETKLLPDAERALADRLDDLGAEMMKRRLQLAAPRAGEIVVNTARSFPVATLAGAGVLMVGAILAGRAYTQSRSNAR